MRSAHSPRGGEHDRHHPAVQIAVYDRYSYLAEKREALNRWAAHALQAVGETPTISAEVVALRA